MNPANAGLFALAVTLLQGCVFVDDEPLSRAYEPCVSTADCERRVDGCYDYSVDYGDQIVRDAMCTNVCIDDLDCPFDGACLSFDGRDPLCYLRCFDDRDCPSSYFCLDAVGRRTIDAVCLPL